MAPVFGHGRLRLYLLKLLEEAPRHGYEVIRLLEERFQGLYAPSAGTVYPRLAKLEAEGLVTHATESGRKVYSITGAGRAELAERRDELADLEMEIHESVAELAAEIREDVRGSARELREEMRAAARQAKVRNRMHRHRTESGRAKEEQRQQWWAILQAEWAALQAEDHTREEVRRIKQRVQEQMQAHLKRGDWPTGVIEGLGELTRELASIADPAGRGRRTADKAADAPQDAPVPEWAAQPGEPSDDPVRDLERLLDRFRDDIRDAARDNGLTADQLRRTRRHLSEAAARIGAVLRGGG